MALRIDENQKRLVGSFSEESYPDECCGFLLGRRSGTDKEVVLIMPTVNEQVRTEKYHRFLISPEAYLKCERYAQENELDILGFYHSHPDAPACPSDFDLKHAWPWYSYIIVSVRKGQTSNVTSWVLADDRMSFEGEVIESNPYSPEEQDVASRPVESQEDRTWD